MGLVCTEVGGDSACAGLVRPGPVERRFCSWCVWCLAARVGLGIQALEGMAPRTWGWGPETLVSRGWCDLLSGQLKTRVPADASGPGGLPVASRGQGGNWMSTDAGCLQGPWNLERGCLAGK